MKLASRRTLEIFLTIILVISLFLPFTLGVTPIDYAFSEFEPVMYLAVSIPVLLIIPFLALLIFKNRTSKKVNEIAKVILILFFLAICGFYIYVWIDEAGLLYNNSLYALFAGLILFLVSLLFVKNETEKTLNLMIAVLALPMIYHASLLESGINFEYGYGGWITEIVFGLIYLSRLSRAYKS